MKKDLHILMLEDDPLDAELNKAQLRLLDEFNCKVHLVSNKESYLDALQSSIPDIVLSDYNLPQYNGIEALTDLKKIHPFVPFVFVTGTMSEETAAGTIKAGAWDYVVKDRLFRLPLAVRSVLQFKEERVNTAKIEAKIRQLSMAIEQSPVHIVITNKDHKIEYVNAKFTEVTGYTLEDVVGKNVTMFHTEKDNKKFEEVLLNDLKDQGVWRSEILSVKKDGTLYWENLSISPIKNEDGEITHFVAVKEDITQRKKMEQDLIEARDRAERSDKLKDAFLQNMSHEIRTPLNAIVGFSELLGMRQIPPDEQNEYTSIIINSSNQLLSIVNDVLTVSRIQTGQEMVVIKNVLLNTLLDNLFTIFKARAQAKNLDFKVYKGSSEPDFTILTDDTKLTQILSNLLNNAFKFTSKGSVDFGYKINEDNVDFFVKDTGIGIPKESHEIIFERFRQAEASISLTFGGTGLGLSISKAFAEMLNGRIWVDSEPGSGATFYLSIPFRMPTEDQSIKHTPSVSIPKKSYTILVAEDEVFNYQLIEAYLAEMNCTLIRAHNGSEAVEICRKNPRIDIVLMDIKMPLMDGATALAEIRKFRATLPVIAQTAYALEQEKQQLLEKGFDDYISKPIKKLDLIQKVVSCLKK